MRNPAGAGSPVSGEQNDECDNQREKRDGFNEGEAQHGHREHGGLSSRVAANSLNEGGEDRANADPGSDNADNREASAEHLCSFKFHNRFPFFEGWFPALCVLVEVQGVVQVQACQNGEDISLQESDDEFEAGQCGHEGQRQNTGDTK